MKKCPKCGGADTISYFPYYCRICEKRRRRESYLKHSVIVKTRRAEYREKHREDINIKKSEGYQKNASEINEQRAIRYREDVRRVMLCSARSRARKKGLEFDLVLDDIPPVPDRCSVFPWIKISIPEYKSQQSRWDGSPSLDRIDNNKGYVKGNVRIISLRANILKKNATQQEVKALYEDSQNFEW